MSIKEWLALSKKNSVKDLTRKYCLEPFAIEALYTKENTKYIDTPYLPNPSSFHVGQEFSDSNKDQIQSALNSGVSLLYFTNKQPNLSDLHFVDFSIIKSFFNSKTWDESFIKRSTSSDVLFYLNDMPFVKHKTISNGISARTHILNGANKSQELAWILFELYQKLHSNSIESLNHIHFTFYNDSDIFLDIAKIRAFRFLYKEIIETFQQELVAPYIHTRFHPSYFTFNEPTTNLMRQTSSVYSSMLSSCQSISLSDYQGRSYAPSVESQRLCRNIQWILKEEASLLKVYDPAKGSYGIESITYMIAEASWSILEKLIAGTYDIQAEVNKVKQQRLAYYKDNKKFLLGTNIYQTNTEKPNKMDSTYLDGVLL